jgi:hypothetical protein
MVSVSSVFVGVSFMPELCSGVGWFLTFMKDFWFWFHKKWNENWNFCGTGILVLGSVLEEN